MSANLDLKLDALFEESLTNAISLSKKTIGQDIDDNQYIHSVVRVISKIFGVSGGEFLPFYFFIDCFFPLFLFLPFCPAVCGLQ